MNGAIENALTLTTVGNAYLAGRDITSFWPNDRTFTFMKICEFRDRPASDHEDDHPLIAAHPMAWFSSLKPKCRGLRLHHAPRPRAPNQQIDAPDRMLSGFVGGGPRWLIETVGDKTSELWEGFLRLGDREDANRKIWLTTYIRQGEMPPSESEPIDLAVALSDLRTVLPEIEALAREEKLENFADCFARARNALEKGAGKADWHADAARYTGYDPRQLAVLEALFGAWVFGGMGSWNDIGGGGPHYDDLSERLFNALNDTVCGLANSTYRG